MKGNKSAHKRVCYCCGSASTYTSPKTGFEYWAPNYDEDENSLCFSCARKLAYLRKPAKELHRRCYCCGMTESRSRHKDAFWNAWYLNHDADDNALCKTCFERLIGSKIQNKKPSHVNWMATKGLITKRRRIMFRGKWIYLKENPRKGICQICGNKSKVTHMHHEKYDETDPLRYTVELCISCHSKTGHRLGQIPNPPH